MLLPWALEQAFALPFLTLRALSVAIMNDPD
jgi:hypothetical protein